MVDIGSGQGDLAVAVHRAHPSAEVLGLEYSEAGVAIASRKAPEATFVQRDLLADEPVPPEHRAWGQQAVCSEVLEHVDEPVVLLRHARDYLAPGCVVIVTVPGGPMSAFDHHIGHRRHFNPASLSALLREAGYDVQECFGAGFPFFNLYRMAVISRGRRLTDDVAGARGLSFTARATMGAFDKLLHLTLERSPWGWQNVGIATVPPS